MEVSSLYEATWACHMTPVHFFKDAVLSCLFLSLCTPCLLDYNGSQEEVIDPLESASDNGCWELNSHPLEGDPNGSVSLLLPNG